MRIYLNKQWKVIIIITIVAVFLAALFIFFKPSTQSAQNLNKGYFVSTDKLETKQYQPIIPITVTARSRKNTTVSAFVSARVEEVHFKVGQKVKKGELLITLEPDLFDIDLDKQSANVDLIKVKLSSNEAQCKLDEALLEQSKSLYKLAQANYERRQTLHAQTYTSKADLDVADEKVVNAKTGLSQQEFNFDNCLLTSKSLEAELRQAKANERLAQKNLKETKVYAPYNGIITDQFVSVGRTVSVGQQLFSIYDPSGVELEGVLTNEVYQKINDHQGLEACRSMSNQENCYSLKRISENISKLGVGHVAFFASKNTNIIAQGQTATLYLRLPKEDAYAVPISAVYNADTIFTIKDKKLVSQKVDVIGNWANDKGKIFKLIEPKNSLDQKNVLASYLPGARTGLVVRFKNEDVKK